MTDETGRFKDDLARTIAEIEAGLHMKDVPPMQESEF